MKIKIFIICIFFIICGCIKRGSIQLRHDGTIIATFERGSIQYDASDDIYIVELGEKEIE